MALPLRAQPDSPQAFLCYADANQATAARLHEDLIARRVRTFRPQLDTLPGDQIVQKVEERIGASDYFLLLWSSACADQSWVRDQWQASLLRKGGFLFVLRLDNTAVPALLAARRQFDAFDDWDSAIAGIVDCWRRDRGIGHPVRPAPYPGGHTDVPTITLYIRNRTFKVSHVLSVPATATGGELWKQVLTELALTDETSELHGRLGGAIGFRFSYTLLRDERPIPDLPLPRLEITEDSVVDLEITIRPFTPRGEHTAVVYRRDPDVGCPGMSPSTRRLLLRKAFGHLVA